MKINRLASDLWEKARNRPRQLYKTGRDWQHMIDLLLRLFVKDNDKVQDPAVRSRYGVLAGSMGILLNLCLCAAKFLAGFLTASISITADAFNNLSDAGSSVVTLIGFQMAGRPADEQHPFGHGRLEYLSGLAVSMAILLVGVELGKSALHKILQPQPVAFGRLSMVILCVSILVKLWMCQFNRALGKRLNSTAMRATAADSLTDAVATLAVLVGMLVGRFTGLLVDGYIGVLVAGFILYSGFSTARDSLSPLLGQPPDEDFVHEIERTVTAHENIEGVHDLIVHDYGPGNTMISLHAEVPSNQDILVMHDLIDQIELELRTKYHCNVTIHMDPIVVDDQQTTQTKEQLRAMIHSIDPALSIHDFRMVQGPTHTNLIFDLLVPYKFRMSDDLLIRVVHEQVTKEIGAEYFAVFQLDKAFV